MNKDSPMVFVVDDDRVLCGQIAEYLGTHGYRTQSFYTTEGLYEAALGNECALILLDIMLPKEGGLDFCRRLRAESRVPVIFMSALGEVTDKVVGLELGADDYLVKPFSTRELLARIRTLLRRVEDAPMPRTQARRYSFDGWQLEVKSRILIDPRGLAINLSAAEFRLLRHFLDHPYEVLERDSLLAVMQRPGEVHFDRVLDVQISRLRSRLGENAKEQKLIRTMRGDGYMLSAEVEAEYPV